MYWVVELNCYNGITAVVYNLLFLLSTFSLFDLFSWKKSNCNVDSLFERRTKDQFGKELKWVYVFKAYSCKMHYMCVPPPLQTSSGCSVSRESNTIGSKTDHGSRRWYFAHLFKEPQKWNWFNVVFTAQQKSYQRFWERQWTFFVIRLKT